MGGGSYSYLSASSLADSYATSYKTSRSLGKSVMNAARDIFESTRLDPEMNIKDKVRESRDSAEHPESFPIIIALDVTGSMGQIPAELITSGFPKIMKGIMDEGIKDPQVCFLGIGDHTCDEAPLQVGQFESSDELLDKWFKKIYLEGRGGSNIGEAYSLAWYFGAYHTSTDSWEKRKKKGVLITIGDEPILEDMSDNSPRHTLDDIFGKNQYSSSSADALRDAKEKWDVYHIHVTSTNSGSRVTRQNAVKQLLAESAVMTESNQTVNEIPALITKLVVDSYKGTTDKQVLTDNVDEKENVVVETKTEKKSSIFPWLDDVEKHMKF